MKMQDITVNKNLVCGEIRLRRTKIPTRKVYVIMKTTKKTFQQRLYADILSRPRKENECLAVVVDLITQTHLPHEYWINKANQDRTHYDDSGNYSMQLATSVMMEQGWEQTPEPLAKVVIQCGYVTTPEKRALPHAWFVRRVSENSYLRVDFTDGTPYITEMESLEQQTAELQYRDNNGEMQIRHYITPTDAELTFWTYTGKVVKRHPPNSK